VQYIQDQPQQEAQERMRSKDTEFAAVKSFFFFGCGIHTASVPSAAETHKGGGAVLEKPEGSPARRHSRCLMF